MPRETRVPGRTGDTAAIEAVASLGDPVRRRLHDAVRAAGRPVSREEAAEATGVSRKLAAFHLDKLVAVGLLQVAERRPGPRGVGRAPKLYEPVPELVTVSLPPRAHDELAAILVDAATKSGPAFTETCLRSARRQGEVGALTGPVPDEAAPPLDRVHRCLADHGYEPYLSDAETLRLRNCPFHPLAQRATELVCGINLGYVSGLLDGLGMSELEATLAPAEGECCVEVSRRGRGTGTMTR